MPENDSQMTSDRRDNEKDRRECDSDRRVTDRIVADAQPRRVNLDRRDT